MKIYFDVNTVTDKDIIECPDIAEYNVTTEVIRGDVHIVVDVPDEDAAQVIEYFSRETGHAWRWSARKQRMMIQDTR